jgi:RNA polymerase sigma-70 factor (ECF subfamily)
VTESHAAVHESVRAACAAGDFQRAATQAFETYGPEVLSFLSTRLRSEAAGQDVFSMFAEDLWRGLPAFNFRCSVRGWLYTLARNAANRYAVAPHNRRARHAPATDHPFLSVLIQRAHATTQLHQRSEVKSKVRALRERLPLEDQTLLILHIDRGLPWRELALVMHDGGPELDGDALTREAARLRKRFERLKSELRELARAEGLFKARDEADSEGTGQ